MKPVRVQRKRTKGFNLQAASPNGLPVVYVGRPTRWGNPYKVGEFEDGSSIPIEPVPKEGFCLPLDMVLPTFEFRVKILLHHRPDYLEPLRGKNLACFCPLSAPCHADVLLRLANQ